jgi:hypothetical protein
MAFIRAPEPAPYLRHTSDNDHNQSTTNNSPTSTETDQPAMPLRRWQRNIQRPIRFRDYLSPDSAHQTKTIITRILAKKIEGSNVLYLVQINGEPAQNSIWVQEKDLSARAIQHIRQRPPPLI